MSSTFKVKCGDLEAVLDSSRFGPGGRSKCILFQGHWISLTKFEDVAGRSSCHNWKRSIRCEGKPLLSVIQEGRLKICDKLCSCVLCQDVLQNLQYENNRESSPTEPDNPQQQTLKPPQVALLKANANQDNDSDSGISMSSCTKALKIDVGSGDGMEEDGGSVGASSSNPEDLDFTALTQEALVALSQSTSDGGCSQMNVLLYILKKYDPPEEVRIVYEKVRSSLRFLKRMGIVERLSVDGSQDLSDSESEDESENGNKEVSKSPDDRENVVPQSSPSSKALVNDSKGAVSKKKSPSAKDKPKGEPKKHKIRNNTNKQAEKVKLNKVKEIKKKKPVNGKNVNSKLVTTKLKLLSPALANVCGSSKLPRHEVVGALWKYVKANNLQDPKDRTFILCDAKVRAVTKKKRVHQTHLLKAIKQHVKDA